MVFQTAAWYYSIRMDSIFAFPPSSISVSAEYVVAVMISPFFFFKKFRCVFFAEILYHFFECRRHICSFFPFKFCWKNYTIFLCKNQWDVALSRWTQNQAPGFEKPDAWDIQIFYYFAILWQILLQKFLCILLFRLCFCSHGFCSSIWRFFWVRGLCRK